MNVYAFNKEKSVRVLNWEPEEVVAQGVHPWQVDLFHPDPLHLTVGSEQIYLTPLDNISLAIVETVVGEAGKLLWADIGQITHGKKISLRGVPLFNPDSKEVELFHLEVMDFDKLLLRYLKQQNEPETRRSTFICEAYEKSNILLLRNARVMLNTNSRNRLSKVPKFTGAMLEAHSIHMKLPPFIKRLFQWFPQGWEPTVFGDAPRQVLRGERIEQVDFFVHPQTAPAFYDHLERMGAQNIRDCTIYALKKGAAIPNGGIVLSFTMPGSPVNYRLFGRWARVGQRPQNRFQQWSWAADELSANLAVIESLDAVTAPRICLWDIAHNQARLLQAQRVWEQGKAVWYWPWQEERRNRLLNQGFSILSNPFEAG